MDKEYWESFYSKQRTIGDPTMFAKHILENYEVKEGANLIELGCGNGRDSTFFHKNGLNVLAVDQAESEIDFLKSQYESSEGITFFCGDFSKLESKKDYDIVYSRFTLHSINATEQDWTLNWVYENLNEGGLFCIEVRGQKNELYEKGEKVAGENDAYIHDNHYRRFIEFNFLCEELKRLGFIIEFSKEASGFAPFKDTNETFIRIISRKPLKDN
jgi:tellurite methyltransferase|tara:strand:- start:10470 stop:11114 length:645 start_codon:yes stop_codon:yes gene_type:complete